MKTSAKLKDTKPPQNNALFSHEASQGIRCAGGLSSIPAEQRKWEAPAACRPVGALCSSRWALPVGSRDGSSAAKKEPRLSTPGSHSGW